MDFFKQECAPDHTNQIQTINLGYAGETYHQLPVMVELKPVPSTLSEDQRVQLFNINPVQFAPQGQIQYVAQKVMPSACIQTQTIQTVHYPEKTTSTHRSVDTQTLDKPYVCKLCGKRFKNPQSLARHHTTHPEIPKSYLCHHCDKKFANQQALRRHQNKHPDIEYEWKCRFCPQSFPYKTTLSKHVKVHAGEKLFKCETCLKRFGNRYSLQRHVKIHTGEVPYKCEVCEKGFLKASDFGRHVRTHTGERPFECPECLKCFTQKSCLVKHAEKKHKIIQL
ncbi:UNVERIFIED_CONTAM: hypothetical protein PYX00_003124 [Menopon gallinae]|uniref:C2H2-type domain-containing protein n=1 Tax=Menopon gallinae TaxID=328185 RepID=A0AAW2I0L5_9NEOP